MMPINPLADSALAGDRRRHSFGSLLREAYDRLSTRPALSWGDSTLTYAELGDRVRALGRGLANAGIGTGDRVILYMENRHEFVEAEQALFTHGVVRVAVSARLHVKEVARIADDSGASAVITTGELALWLHKEVGTSHRCRIITVDGPPAGAGMLGLDQLKNWERCDEWVADAPSPEHLAALLYTSGTTGQPKAAMLTHGNWAAMACNLLVELPPVSGDDTVLHVAPMSHFSGSVGSAYILKGARTTTLPRFDPQMVLNYITDGRVSILPLVPTMLKRLVSAAERQGVSDLHLRAIPYGGSAISPAWLTRATKLFGETLVQLYGLSEVLIPVSALSPQDHISHDTLSSRRLRTAGRPSPFIELRVAEEGGRSAGPETIGEIWVRGETVMAGYWGLPRRTSEMFDSEGWARTGDIGRLTEDGYLELLDRAKDVIASGGFSVYPGEIERCIEELPHVTEALVFGIPDADWGEAVTALVTLFPGVSLSAEEIRAHCKRNIASYKVPRHIGFVDDLPKTDTGKVLRREIRDAYWRDSSRNIGE